LRKHKREALFKRQIQVDEVEDINVKALMMVQRAIRRFLQKRYRDKLKQLYLSDWNKELFGPMTIENINRHRKELASNIMSRPMPNKDTDYQGILNEYFIRYKYFNEDFPRHHRQREDNYNYLHLCKNIIEYMES
jgi:hypothetical protein